MRTPFLILAVTSATLVGCGVLPGTSAISTGDDAATSSTQAFYRVLGLDGTASDAPASDSVQPGGPRSAPSAAGREARIKARFAKLDANGDGQVTYEEFMAGAPGVPQGVSDPGAVFDRIDDNADGGIAEGELRDGCARGGHPGPGEMRRGGKGRQGGHRGRGAHGRGHGPDARPPVPGASPATGDVQPPEVQPPAPVTDPGPAPEPSAAPADPAVQA